MELDPLYQAEDVSTFKCVESYEGGSGFEFNRFSSENAIAVAQEARRAFFSSHMYLNGPFESYQTFENAVIGQNDFQLEEHVGRKDLEDVLRELTLTTAVLSMSSSALSEEKAFSDSLQTLLQKVNSQMEVSLCEFQSHPKDTALCLDSEYDFEFPNFVDDYDGRKQKFHSAALKIQMNLRRINMARVRKAKKKELAIKDAQITALARKTAEKLELQVKTAEKSWNESKRETEESEINRRNWYNKVRERDFERHSEIQGNNSCFAGLGSVKTKTAESYVSDLEDQLCHEKERVKRLEAELEALQSLQDARMQLFEGSLKYIGSNDASKARNKLEALTFSVETLQNRNQELALTVDILKMELAGASGRSEQYVRKFRAFEEQTQKKLAAMQAALSASEERSRHLEVMHKAKEVENQNDRIAVELNIVALRSENDKRRATEDSLNTLIATLKSDNQKLQRIIGQESHIHSRKVLTKNNGNHSIVPFPGRTIVVENGKSCSGTHSEQLNQDPLEATPSQDAIEIEFTSTGYDKLELAIESSAMPDKKSIDLFGYFSGGKGKTGRKFSYDSASESIVLLRSLKRHHVRRGSLDSMEEKTSLFKITLALVAARNFPVDHLVDCDGPNILVKLDDQTQQARTVKMIPSTIKSSSQKAMCYFTLTCSDESSIEVTALSRKIDDKTRNDDPVGFVNLPVYQLTPNGSSPHVWHKEWHVLENHCGNSVRSKRGPAAIQLLIFVESLRQRGNFIDSCSELDAITPEARQRYLWDTNSVLDSPSSGIAQLDRSESAFIVAGEGITLQGSVEVSSSWTRAESVDCSKGLNGQDWLRKIEEPCPLFLHGPRPPPAACDFKKAGLAVPPLRLNGIPRV